MSVQVLPSAQNDDDIEKHTGIAQFASAAALHVRRAIRETGAHKAEELRETYHAVGIDYKTVEELEKPEEFSLKEFFKSLVYETAPAVFVSPLMCCLLEPTIAAGLNVARYRQFLPTRKPGYPPFRSSVIASAVGLSIIAALCLRFSAGEKSDVDINEVFVAFSWLAVRWLVISIKYGFMPKASIAAMQQGTWDNERSQQNLLIRSWTYPDNSLIRTSAKQAQELANSDLGALFFSLLPEHSERFLRELRLQHHGSYNMSTPADADPTEVSVEDMLLAIVASSYGTAPSKVHVMVVPSVCFGMFVIPGIVRVSYGLSFMGSTATDNLIYFGVFLATLSGCLSSLLFCVVASSDLKRRHVVMDMLGRLIVYPGLEFNKVFCRNKSGSGENGCENEKEERFLYINPETEDNCYAWLLMRRTLGMFANNFYRRSLAYIGVIIGWQICAVGYLNIIIWFGPRHHFSSFFSLCCGIMGVAICIQLAMTSAVQLQSIVPHHRLILKRCIVGINQEMVQVLRDQDQPKKIKRGSSGGEWVGESSKHEFAKVSKAVVTALSWKGSAQKKSPERLKNLREMFRSIDDVIAFEEEEKDPVRIFGVAAKAGFTSAVFGVVLAGLGFAAEKYVTSRFSESYTEEGWFVSNSGGLYDD